MAEYFENKLCVSAGELIGAIMSKSCYDKQQQRGKIKVIRRACYDTPALIEFASLPVKYKNEYVRVYGDPCQLNKHNEFKKYLNDDFKAFEFFSNYQLADGRLLPDDKVQELTNNAKVLNALHNIANDTRALRRALNNQTTGIWNALATISEDLKIELGHNLPSHPRKLQEKVRIFKGTGANNYESLIPGTYLNRNRNKVLDIEQEATLRELFRRPNNYDNEQIAMMYNLIAKQMGWNVISASTVGNYRKKWNILVVSGARGSSHFNNTIAMQTKRKAPSVPLIYWTADGWDAELLYQDTKIDSKGNTVTTYHNRLSIIVILDPCGKYPVGYAIGTHESPELIREAFRSAVNHTQELFGARYRVGQLQTDNYAKKSLANFYEAISSKYTPAAVKNAKSKVVEPYFYYLNKDYCQFQYNWSGFGVTSDKDSQPNAEYLNKIRKDFPDMEGCKLQIVSIIEQERAKKVDQYRKAFLDSTHVDRIQVSEMEYYYMLGESKEKTTRMQPEGFLFQINNNKFVFDTFNKRFRELSYIDWNVKYDPANMEKVLVHDESGTHRFILDQKYVNAMAIQDRVEGDSERLHEIFDFNKSLRNEVMDSMSSDREIVNNLFNNNTAIQDVLSKFLLTDSNGQHKNQKSAARLGAAAVEKFEAREDLNAEKSFSEIQREYLASKVDLSNYIN
jgi:hypothetical protein